MASRRVIQRVSGGDSRVYRAAVMARDEAQGHAQAAGQDRQSVADELGTILQKAGEVETARGQVQQNRGFVAGDREQTGLDRIATGQDRTQTGLDRDAASSSAAAALASRLAAAATEANVSAAVANAAVRRATLAELQSVTTAATGAVGEVYGEEANNGTYRWSGSAWALVSRATVPSLDDRVATLEPLADLRALSPVGGEDYSSPVAGYRFGLVDQSGRIVFGVSDAVGVSARSFYLPLNSPDDSSIVPIISGNTGRMLIGYDGTTASLFSARYTLTGLRLRAYPDQDDYAELPLVWTEAGKVLIGSRADGLRLTLSQTALDLADTSRRLSPDAVPASILADPDDVRRISANLLSARGPDENGINRRFFIRRDITPGCAMADTRGPVELTHLYGQSLSIAGGSNEIPNPADRIARATPARPYTCLAFNDGTIGAVAADDLAEASLVDFMPAVEEAVMGDSGLNAYGDMRESLRTAAGLPRRTFLLRSHGKGGRPITSLKKGTQGYENGLRECRAAVRIAAKYGRSLTFRDWIWQQGQTQTSDPPTVPPLSDPIGYYNEMIQLATDYAADHAANIPGVNASEVICWIEQTSASEAGNTLRGASLGQLKAAEDFPATIKVIGPYYYLDGDYGLVDDVHLKPLGYCILREQAAKAHHTQRDLGTNWTGVRPKGLLQISGTTSIIPLWKQSGYALTFDTTTIPPQSNMGVVLEGYGDGVTITGVNLVDVDATTCNLVVTTSAAPTGATPVISYARSGGTPPGRPAMRVRGNIADTDPTMSRAVPGYRLRNWCCIFEKGTV